MSQDERDIKDPQVEDEEEEEEEEEDGEDDNDEDDDDEEAEEQQDDSNDTGLGELEKYPESEAANSKVIDDLAIESQEEDEKPKRKPKSRPKPKFPTRFAYFFHAGKPREPGIKLSRENMTLNDIFVLIDKTGQMALMYKVPRIPKKIPKKVPESDDASKSVPDPDPDPKPAPDRFNYKMFAKNIITDPSNDFVFTRKNDEQFVSSIEGFLKSIGIIYDVTKYTGEPIPLGQYSLKKESVRGRKLLEDFMDFFYKPKPVPKRKKNESEEYMIKRITRIQENEELVERGKKILTQLFAETPKSATDKSQASATKNAAKPQLGAKKEQAVSKKEQPAAKNTPSTSPMISPQKSKSETKKTSDSTIKAKKDANKSTTDNKKQLTIGDMNKTTSKSENAKKTDATTSAKKSETNPTAAKSKAVATKAPATKKATPLAADNKKKKQLSKAEQQALIREAKELVNSISTSAKDEDDENEDDVVPENEEELEVLKDTYELEMNGHEEFVPDEEDEEDEDIKDFVVEEDEEPEIESRAQEEHAKKNVSPTKSKTSKTASKQSPKKPTTDAMEIEDAVPATTTNGVKTSELAQLELIKKLASRNVLKEEELASMSTEDLNEIFDSCKAIQEHSDRVHALMAKYAKADISGFIKLAASASKSVTKENGPVGIKKSDKMKRALASH